MDVHEVVKERYGSIASGGQSCCGDDCCNTTLYDEALIQDLPVDVTGLSLGCGDPVSIASLKAGRNGA